MHTQHIMLTKTFEISDSICQFLTHHAKNISLNSRIGSSCHSRHDGSIHCLTYKIESRNTPSPPHFTSPREHWAQGYDGTPTSQIHSPDGCIIFHASHLYRSINRDASYLYRSINHDASYLCTTINCIDPASGNSAATTVHRITPHSRNDGITIAVQPVFTSGHCRASTRRSLTSID